MCRPGAGLDWRTDRKEGTTVEGKIEGRGTRRGCRPGLHVGWGGTPPALRGASGRVKDRKEKDLSRASPHGLRWSCRRGWG